MHRTTSQTQHLCRSERGLYYLAILTIFSDSCTHVPIDCIFSWVCLLHRPKMRPLYRWTAFARMVPAMYL